MREGQSQQPKPQQPVQQQPGLGQSQQQPQFDTPQAPQAMPEQQQQVLAQQQILEQQPSQQQMPGGPQQYVQQQMVPQQMMQQPQPVQMQQQPSGAVEYGSVNQRFKTQKCRHFDNKGFCQWNENCQYAHGDTELRDINDPIPDHMRMQASRRVVTGQRQMNNTPGGGQNQGAQSQGYNNHSRGGYSSRGGSGYSRGGGDQYNSGYSGRGGHQGGAAGGYQSYNNNAGGIQGGNNYYQNNGGMGRGSNRGGMGAARGGSHMGSQMYGEDNDFQGVRRGGRGGGRGGAQGGYQGAGGPQGGNQGFKNHKTVICKHFSAGKTCPYQNNCTYAHGMVELRQSAPGQGGSQYGGNTPQVYQNKQQQQYMNQIAMPHYQTAQPVYGGIIQPVGMPGQMGGPQNFGEPMIIYGEPSNAHQRYDYSNGQGAFDQQQMIVNGQNQPSQGMPPMYMAANVQQPGGPGGIMLQQPMVAPVQTQIVINSTSDGPDGQTIQTQRVLTIFIMHNNQEVQEQIKMATGMADQGNYEQALQLLSQLHESGKISMQETSQQNFGDPQDLSYMQQQPQNDAGVVQENAEHK